MRDTSIPLFVVVGLASAFLGDTLVRLDGGGHHLGVLHVAHTMLIAVPAGVMAALLLREESVVAAALLTGGGWIVGLGLIALGT